MLSVFTRRKEAEPQRTIWEEKHCKQASGIRRAAWKGCGPPWKGYSPTFYAVYRLYSSQLCELSSVVGMGFYDAALLESSAPVSNPSPTALKISPINLIGSWSRTLVVCILWSDLCSLSWMRRHVCCSSPGNTAFYTVRLLLLLLSSLLLLLAVIAVISPS